MHDSSLDLLDAATNSDPNPAQGEGGVALSDGSALVAHAGPERSKRVSEESESVEDEDEDEDTGKRVVSRKEDPEEVEEAAPAPAPSASYAGLSDPIPAGRLSQGIHGNNGVDFSAPRGSAIVAAAAGTVVVARSSGWNGGYGNYAIIEHASGVRTLYAHMDTVAVTEGEAIGTGESVGTVGNTGQSTGYHLHFEVKGAKNPFGS